MEGDFKHITFEQRKVILSAISSKHKIKEIGEAFNLDSTSISKDIKKTELYYIQFIIQRKDTLCHIVIHSEATPTR